MVHLIIDAIIFHKKYDYWHFKLLKTFLSLGLQTIHKVFNNKPEFRFLGRITSLYGTLAYSRTHNILDLAVALEGVFL